MIFTLLLIIDYTFDPFVYIQDQDSLYIDTIIVPGLSYPIVEFSFDAIPDERFSITNIGKIKKSMDSSLVAYCTSKATLEALEDIEDYGKLAKIRYGLKIVRDSILFNLTWADTSGSYKNATIKLFQLKHMLLCPDKSCTDLYLDSLKSSL
jgi:hypothetical protein